MHYMVDFHRAYFTTGCKKVRAIFATAISVHTTKCHWKKSSSGKLDSLKLCAWSPELIRLKN